MTSESIVTMNTTGREPVIRWIKSHAQLLTTIDPRAPLTDLRPLGDMVHHATVVGFGGSTRGAHELSLLQHRALRFLVEHLGFRALALEEDWTNGVQLDQYVRTGRGDPWALLAGAWLPWQTEEMLDVLRWLRSYNEQHPDDPVRVVGLDTDAVRALAYDAVADYVRRTAPGRLAELEAHYTVLRPAGGIAEHVRWYGSQQEKQPLIDHARLAYALVEGLAAHEGHALALQHARAVVGFFEYHALDGFDVDRRFAENAIWWHNHTAARIVYWGGTAHTVSGNPRIASPPSGRPRQRRAAGGYLRDRFGPGYVSIGLTFDHGSLPYPVPAPPPEFADAALGSAGIDTYLLDLHAPQPDSVRAWLNAPARTRVIGPNYQPEADPDHHMSGGSLAGWFDLIIHSQEVTSTRPLA